MPLARWKSRTKPTAVEASLVSASMSHSSINSHSTAATHPDRQVYAIAHPQGGVIPSTRLHRRGTRTTRGKRRWWHALSIQCLFLLLLLLQERRGKERGGSYGSRKRSSRNGHSSAATERRCASLDGSGGGRRCLSLPPFAPPLGGCHCFHCGWIFRPHVGWGLHPYFRFIRR